MRSSGYHDGALQMRDFIHNEAARCEEARGIRWAFVEGRGSVAALISTR